MERYKNIGAEVYRPQPRYVLRLLLATPFRNGRRPRHAALKNVIVQDLGLRHLRQEVQQVQIYVESVGFGCLQNAVTQGTCFRTFGCIAKHPILPAYHKWTDVKAYLVSAFGREACRAGMTVRCYKMSRLLLNLSVGRGDGSYEKLISDLKKPNLLILDDFGLESLQPIACLDLYEVVDE